MSKTLSAREQDDLVAEMCTNIDTDLYDDDEWDEMFNKLDSNHQDEVRESLREFANAAVGDDHWDDDD